MFSFVRSFLSYFFLSLCMLFCHSFFSYVVLYLVIALLMVDFLLSAFIYFYM